MPNRRPPSNDLGERIADIGARFDVFEKYSHERWHNLANALQPLALLPERITRDIAKMQGNFDGRINAVTRDIERSIKAAIDEALSPIRVEVDELKGEVEALKADSLRLTGAKIFLVWIVQTMISALAVFFAVRTTGGR